MKKIAQMTAGEVLRRVFCGIVLLFLAAAFAAPDRKEMLTGLARILTKPAQLTKDYFCMEIGSVSGAFLNSFLVGTVSAALLYMPGATPNGGSFAAGVLTLGFAFFGVNALNMLPFIPGVWLYSAIRHERLGKNVNTCLFATALSPIISEALFVYPGTAVHIPQVGNVLLALGLGVIIGFCMPVLCAHSQGFHLGYDLYNAGPAAGFLGFAIYATLYRTLGVTAPEITAILGENHCLFCNALAGVIFIAALVIGFIWNGRSFKGYKRLLLESGRRTDFTQKYSAGLCLINFALYGFTVLAYYNLIGASFTGPTFCCIWGMVSFAAYGATPANVIPIMIGYFLASRFGATPLNAQSIVVGLCFGTGLAPVAGRFGPIAGIFAGILHYCLVTSVVFIHGGMNLYNGGFTSGIAAFLIAPLLERFAKPVRYATDYSE